MYNAVVLGKVGYNKTTTQPESQESIEPIVMLYDSFGIKEVTVKILDLLEYNRWTWLTRNSTAWKSRNT